MNSIDQQPQMTPPVTATTRYEPRLDLLGPPEQNETAEPGAGEMLLRLHLMMRGKYLVSCLAAILLAGGLGYLGYRLGQQTFRSTGQIRIVPTLPKVMYSTEDKGVMPMFDSFVMTQASLIKTQRVIEIALEDRSWPTPPPRDDAAISEFAKNLNVVRDNELIAVTYDANDPAFAQSAVRAVIAAYRKLYIEADGRENEQVLNQLTQRQTSLNNELAANRARIRAISEQYNTDQLDGVFADQQSRVSTAEKALALAKDAQVSLEAATKAGAGSSPQVLAASDAKLTRLLQEQAQRELELDQLESSRVGPMHESMLNARKSLDTINRKIADRVSEVISANAADDESSPAKQLSKRIAELSDDLGLQRQALKNIGQDRFQLNDLKREASEIEEKLRETKQRLDQLTTEAPVSTGRVTVISDGDRPLAPAKDTRKTFAGAGGVMGFCLPFGLALALAGANRKYKGPAETRMSAITRDLVLGALPAVDERAFDSETSTIAAHCLHQVRTMLQIRCKGRAKAIAITSSRAGSGKTSVVLGLGVSYAMAGSKTLLIDLDLVGGGLTRRTEIQARARLGSLLVQQGLATDEQLQAALRLAKEKQLKLGEAFVEAGFLSREQLESILKDQKRSHAGLMEALYGTPLTQCVSEAGMPGLDILPLGSANPHDAATLSPEEIKHLIDEAKTLYDTVLIDTGPVPGSLEASLAASITDGVLLIVARGEARSAAEASLEHLRRVGGRVMGMVFNRARPSDAGMIAGSLYNGGTSLRVPSDRHVSPAAAARQAASARFGPVGQAILDLAPNSEAN